MMQAWADYVDSLRAGNNVVPLKISAYVWAPHRSASVRTYAHSVSKADDVATL
jgi:hypothetical protein